MPEHDPVLLRGLRLGLVGPVIADSFTDNLADAARSLGAAVTLLGGATPRVRLGPVQLAGLASRSTRLVAAWQKRLIDRAEGLDIVLAVEATLAPATVAALRSRGTAVALWFPDAVSNIGRQFAFAAPYSLVCFKEPRLVERANALLDRPIRLLHEGCNPRWHHPPDEEPQRDDVIVVVGNLYPWRVALLERLIKAAVPIRLYGDPPSSWIQSPVRVLHTNEYVARERKAEVFRGAAAVLNNLHPAEIDGVNARLFEASACGALVITEQRRLLPALFKPESEVLSFADFDELVDRCRWALANPDEGRRIGTAAAARAHGDHTLQHRLTDLVDWLGME